MEPVGEFYSKWKAIEAMEHGEIAILAGGTGNPFSLPILLSALRAVEIEADAMFKEPAWMEFTPPIPRKTPPPPNSKPSPSMRFTDWDSR